MLGGTEDCWVAVVPARLVELLGEIKEAAMTIIEHTGKGGALEERAELGPELERQVLASFGKMGLLGLDGAQLEGAQRAGNDLVVTLRTATGIQQVVLENFYLRQTQSSLVIGQNGERSTILQNSDLRNATPEEQSGTATSEDAEQARAPEPLHTESGSVIDSALAQDTPSDTRTNLFALSRLPDASKLEAKGDDLQGDLIYARLEQEALVGARLGSVGPILEVETQDSTPPDVPSVFMPAASFKLEPAEKNSPDILNRAAVLGASPFTGKAEPRSRVTLEVSDSAGNSTQVTAEVGDDGSWSAAFMPSALLQLQEGVAYVCVFATDAAGNASAKSTPYPFELHATQPASPKEFTLTTRDDTGASNTDKLTNMQQPGLGGKAPANVTQVVLYHDINGDGKFSEFEKLGAARVGADGSFEWRPPYALTDGAHNFFVQSIDRWGNISSGATKTTFTVDAVLDTALSMAPVMGDDVVSYPEMFDNSDKIRLDGKGEKGAKVHVVLRQGEVSYETDVTVDETNTWHLRDINLRELGFRNGRVEFALTQEDVAGNKSLPLTRSVPMRITPVPPISSLELDKDSDSGNSDKDHITNVQRPTFTGTLKDAGPGLHVRLYVDSNHNGLVDEGDQFLGQTELVHALSGKDAAFRYTLQQALGDGTHTILAQTWELAHSQNALIGAGSQMAVTLDTQVTQPTLDPVTPDNIIGTNDLGDNIHIVGKAEPRAKVRVTLRAGESPLPPLAAVVADVTGKFAIPLSREYIQQMGNGKVTIKVDQTDVAGNTTSIAGTGSFEIHTGALNTPTALQLAADDDTGVSHSDRITSKSALRVSGVGPLPINPDNKNETVTIHLFNDKNGDGIFSSGADDDLGSVLANKSNGAFAFDIALPEGRHSLRSYATNGNGQRSGENQATIIVVDQGADPVGAVQVANDNSVNNKETEDGFAISGTGEAGAAIAVDWVAFGKPDAVLLRSSSDILVAPNGTWRAQLNAGDIAQLPEGRIIARVTQTDRAGNVSAVVEHSFEIDRTAPDAPTDANNAAAANWNQHHNRPWADGITWGDLYKDSNDDGVREAQTLEVAVALPANAQVGERLELNWGGNSGENSDKTRQTFTVTDDDLARGYLLAGMLGNTIAAAGVQERLTVSGTFIDQAGNRSATPQLVLFDINQPLTARPPTLTIDEAHANPNTTDRTHYSNHGPGSSEKSLTFRGTADPNARVTIFIDQNNNGEYDADESVLVTTDAGPDGKYEGDFQNNGQMPDGLHHLRAIGESGGHRTDASDVYKLQIDTQPPAAPTLDQSVIAGDDLVNKYERLEMPTWSGTGEPGAQVLLTLTHTTTKVVGSTRVVRVDANGKWSYQPTVVDLGQVGEGRLQLDIWQSDLAGNNGPPTQRHFTYDATTALPTLDAVADDDQVSQEELSLNSSRLQLTGTGESGGQVFITLRGAVGTIGPLSPGSLTDSDGRWVLNLSKEDVATLGEGSVSAELTQRDPAGNVSNLARRSFMIDRAVAAPTLDMVAGDDTLNASELAQGIRLGGNGEAGASVKVTLIQGRHAIAHSTIANNSGTWELSLAASDLSVLGNGSMNIRVQQTDAAGNGSPAVSRKIAVLATPLTPTIAMDRVGGDDLLDVREQESDQVLSGTGPASTHLTLVLSGKHLALTKTAAIGESGHWSVPLSKEDMRALGQGKVSIRGSAVDDSGASSRMVSKEMILETSEPSPLVDPVAQNGMINGVEVAAGVQISGSGVAGHRVRLVFASASDTFTKFASVGSGGKFSYQLSPADISNLGEGRVSLQATQFASSALDAMQSVTVDSAFEVDTVAPTITSISPTGEDVGAAALAAAAIYNQRISAMQDGVTVGEALNGVQVAVPLMKDGSGKYVLKMGDKITLNWGSQAIEHLVGANDLLGRQYVLINVAPSDIAKAGNGPIHVSAQFSDKAGNRSDTLSLMQDVAVTVPPPPPNFDAISGDGYVNAAERAELRSTGRSLAIKGSANGAGKMGLKLTGDNGHVISLTDVQVNSGNWTAALTPAQLVALGEGSIALEATFTASSGATVTKTSSFVCDISPPTAPTEENIKKAQEANALSELAGGVIKDPGAKVTEAASSVQVRVPLPVNASAGDKVTLFWGRQEVEMMLTQTAINAGMAAVTVSSAHMTTQGDHDHLPVQARFTDRAGNAGGKFEVWRGKVDALPTPPSIDAPAVGEWLNLDEAQNSAGPALGWQLSGAGLASSTVTLALAGQGKGLSKTVAVDERGKWLVPSLSLAETEELLGGRSGAITVTATQTDNTGNVSTAVSIRQKVDVDPPAAPTINVPSNLTYAQTQSGSNYSGTADAGASVVLEFKRGGAAIEKEVRADAAGNWSQRLEKSDYDALADGGTAATHIVARQIDVAGNPSPATTSVSFKFSNTEVASPAVLSVTGLGENDAAINSLDLGAAHRQSLSIQGTGIARDGANNSRIKVVMTVGGVDTVFDAVAVDGGGNWMLTLNQAQITALGQGRARIKASNLVDADGMVDESLPSHYTLMMGAERHSEFVIDTIAPTITQAQISATGAKGNAKAGDVVSITLSTSENIVLSGGSPALQLMLGTQPVSATYDALASAALGGDKMVFRYTVVAGNNSTGTGLAERALTADALQLNGASLRDAAGNPSTLVIGTVHPNTVQVDTIAPGQPVLASINAEGALSPGGSMVNLNEAQGIGGSAALELVVGLEGADVKPGDVVQLTWGENTYRNTLTVGDVARAVALLRPPPSLVGSTQSKEVAVTVRIEDQAGNTSPPSAGKTVVVDTLAPVPLDIAAWLGDNKVNAIEYAAATMADLVGTGAEERASLSAALVQGRSTPVRLSIGATGGGGWKIDGAALKSELGLLSDGDFEIRVWQTDMAANVSELARKTYTIDREAPRQPTIDSVTGLEDGWINKEESGTTKMALGGLNGSGALSGDEVVIGGLGADGSLEYRHKLTGADIAQGTLIVTFSQNLLTQGSHDAPVSARDFTVHIADRGGNESAKATHPFKLDTNVATPRTSMNGAIISPARASAGVPFEGTNIENGASVVIIIKGESGETLRIVPTVTGEAFRGVLTPSDLRTLGEGPATYDILQTDPAGNVNARKTEGFAVLLNVEPPVLNDFAGDNTVGASEASATQVYSGTGTVNAPIELTFKGAGGSSLVKTTTVGENGKWSVNLIPADFTTLRNGKAAATVQVEASAGGSDARSDIVKDEFKINAAQPAVAGMQMFDGNGDGANNDGIQINFDERVRAQDLRNIASYTLPASKTFGTHARVEVLDSAVINGTEFVKAVQIYLGGNANIAKNDKITIAKDKLINDGANEAARDQSITIQETLDALPIPVPELNISHDNVINAAEKAGSTKLEYTYNAVPAGSKVRLYRDGVLVSESTVGTTTGSTTTKTTFSLTGDAHWGGDGIKGISAQIVHTDGRTSRFSLPKSVLVDTRVAQGNELVTLTTDVATLGALGSGDVVRLGFQEAVTFTNANLPVSFGRGATMKAVAAASGVSQAWDITLGSGATVRPGDVQTIKGVTDQAGNRDDIAITIPGAIAQPQPGVPSIANVSSDNVLTRADGNATAAVTVNLKNTAAGDVVKLFVDGVEVGSVIAAAGAASAVFEVKMSDFGADGTRTLTTSVQRGGQSAVYCVFDRNVYVARDSVHWSASAGSDNVLWFDPDTLIGQDVGSPVMRWDSSVGNIQTQYVNRLNRRNGAGPNVLGGKMILYQDGNGRASVQGDGKGAMWSAQEWDTNVSTGFTDFQTYRFLEKPSNWTYPFTHSATLERTPTTGAMHERWHAGILNDGTTLFASITGVSGSFKYANGLTVNSWVQSVSQVDSERQLRLGTNGELPGDSVQLSAGKAHGAYTRQGVAVGGSRASNGDYHGLTESHYISNESVAGLLGDMISIKRAIGRAYWMEIASYIGAKYQTSGSIVSAKTTDKHGALVYDLSTSAQSSQLIDQMTSTVKDATADTFITAGSDYVNAGSGDDTVRIRDVEFRLLDGGLGRDTLALDADFAGRTSIILADYVVNARGTSGVGEDDARVNAAGYHKLQGFEVIDTRGSAQRQLLTIAAADVAQLSDTDHLEVWLGRNDVLTLKGFTSSSKGIFRYQDRWFDWRHSAVVNDQNVTLYSSGGDQQASIKSMKYTNGGNLLHLRFDHAMIGGVNNAEFTFTGLDGYNLPDLGDFSLTMVYQRQGIQFSFANAITGATKVVYKGGLQDEAGRGLASKVWLLGHDGDDTNKGDNTLDGTTATQSEQGLGLIILGGGGNDTITGGSGSDTIIGGMGADHLTGGAGSDTFKYVNEMAAVGGSAGLGGLTGDVITDFNLGKGEATNADRLDLRDLFASSLAATGEAASDAQKLVAGKYLDIVKRMDGGKRNWEIWVDRDGGGIYGLMTTLQNVEGHLGEFGKGTNITGTEGTQELLTKLLEEGRFVVV